VLARRASLPPNVHLTTTHMLGPTTMLLRLAHVYDAGEDAVYSKTASVDLATLFGGPARILSCDEMTLPGWKKLADVPKTTYKAADGSSVTLPFVPPPPAGAGLTVTLDVQDIRTFQCVTAGN
jgi:alpha-mannosidase